MLAFSPIAVHEPWTGCRLSLDNKEPLVDPTGPGRAIERLVTRVCFHAACAGTGCRTGYALEKCYGPKTGGSQTEWVRKRRSIWTTMQRGSPLLRPALKRGCPALEARLHAVGSEAPLVHTAPSWPLWRLIDPAALRADELAISPPCARRFGALLPDMGMFTERFTLDYMSRMRKALHGTDTRYDAASALWYHLRRAEFDSHLAAYLLNYLLWKEHERCMEGDPVLGPVTADLHRFTAHWFGHVLLRNPRGDVDERSFAHLNVYGLELAAFVARSVLCRSY